MKKEKQKKQTAGDTKGKTSFDENGEGTAPKYGAAGDTPNESGDKNSEKAIDKSTS